MTKELAWTYAFGLFFSLPLHSLFPTHSLSFSFFLLFPREVAGEKPPRGLRLVSQLSQVSLWEKSPRRQGKGRIYWFREITGWNSLRGKREWFILLYNHFVILYWKIPTATGGTNTCSINVKNTGGSHKTTFKHHEPAGKRPQDTTK